MAFNVGKRVVREAGRQRWTGTQRPTCQGAVALPGPPVLRPAACPPAASCPASWRSLAMARSCSLGQRGISTHWPSAKHDNLVEGRVYGVRKRLVDVESKQDESKQDKPCSGGGGSGSGIESIEGGEARNSTNCSASSHVCELPELTEDLDDLDWSWDGKTLWSDFIPGGEAPSHVYELTQDLEDLDWSWDGISPRSDPLIVVSNEDDLGECIKWKQVECANENPDHTFVNALKHENWLDDNKYLESDGDDAKLLLKIYFKIHVKISALILRCPSKKGPKILKLFFNKPNLDLSDAEGTAQEVEVSPEHLLGAPIQLDTARFGEVESLQVRFEGNDGTPLQIQKLSIIGSKIPTTPVEDFEPQHPNAHVQTQFGDSIK